MKRFPDLLRHLAAGLAFGLALVGAVGALAGQGGRWSDLLDILNEFAPFWLAFGVLALALWLAAVRHGRLTPVLAGLAMVSAAALMAPEFVANAATVPATPGAETLKYIQFNLWGQNRDPEGTARWILQQDADIVVLEEAYGRGQEVVKALRDHYPYRTRCGRHLTCSTIILAKVKPTVQVRLAEGGLDPWTDGVSATFPAPGGPVTVVGLHMNWPWPPGLQQAQGRAVAGWLAPQPRDRTILSGDFNATPWSFSLRRQDTAFGLERRTRALASWPARRWPPLGLRPPPFLPIDQVYAGKGWRTVSVTRGPPLGSDHYPVVAEFQAAR